MSTDNWITVINTYSTLINSALTLLTIIVSIIAIIVTMKIAKKQRKLSETESVRQRQEYKESLENQRKQFEIELKRNEENERIHEQPYLVFLEAKISDESDEKITRIDVVFRNKGRGSAYDIIPTLECKASTIQGEKVLRRCDAIQDPIAMVGETFRTMWTLGYETNLIDFIVTIPLNYKDASGREYIQKYDIIFNKDNYASITNFAQPELCVK